MPDGVPGQNSQVLDGGYSGLPMGPLGQSTTPSMQRQSLKASCRFSGIQGLQQYGPVQSTPSAMGTSGGRSQATRQTDP
jgi:hypothetical protein